jgi:hypothetical protein
MTNDLTVNHCKPSIFFLLHLPKRGGDFFKLSFGAVVAVENALLVIALDCSVSP